MNKKLNSREYDFTLVLDGVTELTEVVESALFEAGCDDATISLRSGRVFLTFSRRASSLKEAVISAIRAVNHADIGAVVLRVDSSNLATQADIARRIGRTRQLVHQYIAGVRGPGRFPPPACESADGAPLWYWCEVARWLWENDMIQEDVLRDAEELAVINSVLELQRQRHVAPELTAEILRFVDFCAEPAKV
ncbi:MAG: hypothetical protein KJ000_27245 [Pirellulaceae bacterium]|nr:hypothetical protein [Pirellulaceae bacterium]